MRHAAAVAGFGDLKAWVQRSPLNGPASYAWGAVRLTWPRRPAHALELWRTRNPQTFGEKVRYKMARDRSPVLATLVDKVAMREYVSDRLGADALPHRYAAVRRAAELPWGDLPREFVLKAAHASGGVIVVADSASADARLPSGRSVPWARFWVRPEHADRGAMERLGETWLRSSYAQGPVGRWEWAYRDVPRALVVDEYVGDGQRLPRELKLMCIHGEPQIYSVLTRDHDFTLEPPIRFLPGEETDARRALDLDVSTWAWLTAASRSLSAGRDLLRVDWMLSSRGPLVGELTVYPTGGSPTFEGHRSLTSREVDAILSGTWAVTPSYH